MQPPLFYNTDPVNFNHTNKRKKEELLGQSNTKWTYADIRIWRESFWRIKLLFQTAEAYAVVMLSEDALVYGTVLWLHVWSTDVSEV